MSKLTSGAGDPAVPAEGSAPTSAAELRRREFNATWDQPRGFLGAFQVIDNIPIAVRYMATSFAFFLAGGVLALVMRLQLARPDNRVLDAETYNQFFTMHGTTMMFLFVIPFLEAFANYVIPLLNGTRDLPFPRLTALSYWTYLFGGIFIYSSFLIGAAPDGGWFAYVPLNLKEFSPGLNMDFWDIGLSVAEVAAIGAAAEMIVGILRMRAPGMSLNRLPIFCWALLVTSIAQQKSGSRLSDMPGARIRRMPTIISAAAPMAAISATLRPMSQKSMFSPGEYRLSLSGT